MIYIFACNFCLNISDFFVHIKYLFQFRLPSLSSYYQVLYYYTEFRCIHRIHRSLSWNSIMLGRVQFKKRFYNVSTTYMVQVLLENAIFLTSNTRCLENWKLYFDAIIIIEKSNTRMSHIHTWSWNFKYPCCFINSYFCQILTIEQ